jgi:hypothetical protein
MCHRTRLPGLLAFVAAMFGAAHAGGSAAQDLLPAEVAAQTTIYTDAGTRGCGLRLFAAHVASDLWIVGVETFIDVHVDGRGSFKGEVSEFAAPAHGRNANPAPVAIESIWVKPPDMGLTTPVLGKVDKGEGGYSLQYAIDADSAIAVMLSAMKGESVLFGFKRIDQPAEHIYVGAPKLTRDESERLQRCISNLTK